MVEEHMKTMAGFLRYCSKVDDALSVKMGAVSRCQAIAEAARAFLEGPEINGIARGKFSVDLFINDLGNLGISVEHADKPEIVRDIFVQPDLDPTKVVIG